MLKKMQKNIKKELAYIKSYLTQNEYGKEIYDIFEEMMDKIQYKKEHQKIRNKIYYGIISNIIQICKLYKNNDCCFESFDVFVIKDLYSNLIFNDDSFKYKEYNNLIIEQCRVENENLLLQMEMNILYKKQEEYIKKREDSHLYGGDSYRIESLMIDQEISHKRLRIDQNNLLKELYFMVKMYLDSEYELNPNKKKLKEIDFMISKKCTLLEKIDLLKKWSDSQTQKIEQLKKLKLELTKIEEEKPKV